MGELLCSLRPCFLRASLWSQRPQSTAAKRSLVGTWDKGVLSGLGVGWGVEGQGSEVGNPAVPSSSSTSRGFMDQSPWSLHFLCWALSVSRFGSFAQESGPSCSTYLVSMGQDGRVGPALAMLGAYQRIQGWSAGVWTACPAGVGT